MHYLGRFFYGVWRGLDALRRVLHLLLLLALLVVAIGALEAMRPPRLPQRAALVLRPSGQIVEQLSGAPLARTLSEARGQGAPQTLLWDLTTAIRAAAGDRRIGALVIDTDDMSASGQVKLEELAAAIRDFRRSGKPVIAFGHNYSQSQFLLAAQADEIYLDPLGVVLLDGYSRYRLYFKNALQKYDVDVHLFRVGKYKSAEEPFIRTNMSSADRQESEAYLSALWSGYCQAVSAARHLTASAVAGYANDYVDAVVAAGGDTAQVAKNAGLVTSLATEQQVDQRLMRLVGADPSGQSYRQVGVEDYLRATHAAQRLRGRGPAVGVVIASGDILDGRQPPGAIGGESTADLLRQARLDHDIKAVVLRIDSPGGSVMASEQIYRAVLALEQAGKPVVASMSDVAASGGYYIAAGANEIIASPNTITGSIGVFAAFPTFERTLAKFGVDVDGVGTTPLSGETSLVRPLSPAAGKLLQTVVDYTYQQFVSRVAKGRGKPAEAIDAIGQGHVWAGTDALRIGLVDKLGGYQEAVHDAARRAGLKGTYGIRRIRAPLNWTEQLLLQLSSHVTAMMSRSGFFHMLGAVGGLGRAGAAAPAGPAQLAQQLQRLTPVGRLLARWTRLSSRNSVYAYCFCTVQ